MTTQPEPRSVTEALRAAAEDVDAGWYGASEGGMVRMRYASDLPRRLSTLRVALAEASNPAPAVVGLVLVRENTGGVFPDGTTNHPPIDFGAAEISWVPAATCDGCGASVLSLRHFEGCPLSPRSAPAVVPDVEEAWEALVDGLDAVNSRSFGMRYIVEEHRPLIEAAIRAAIYAEDVAEYERPLLRAEGRGALDVERRTADTIRAKVATMPGSLPGVDESTVHRREVTDWISETYLAQREPAESQGPDGGLEQILAEQRAEDEATERQGEAEDAAGSDRWSPR